MFRLPNTICIFQKHFFFNSIAFICRCHCSRCGLFGSVLANKGLSSNPRLNIFNNKKHENKMSLSMVSFTPKINKVAMKSFPSPTVCKQKKKKKYKTWTIWESQVVILKNIYQVLDYRFLSFQANWKFVSLLLVYRIAILKFFFSSFVWSRRRTVDRFTQIINTHTHNMSARIAKRIRVVKNLAWEWTKLLYKEKKKKQKLYLVLLF